MKKNSKILILFDLLLTFFKIGLFTFGGGYAMIPLISKEAVDKKKWATDEEIVDIISIAESTPGPIAVNASTYIGFKVAGLLGAVFSTLGLAIPSFLIIFVISFFYKQFMQIEIIQSIFKGLSIGVIVIISGAFFRLKKSMKLNVTCWIVFAICLILLLLNTFFNLNIPFFTLILIFCGFIFGIVFEAIKGWNKK